MQLLIKRSQRAGGVLGNKVLFALNARAELTPEEGSLVDKYKLGQIVVYDSEARKKHNAAAYGHFDDSAHTPGYDLATTGKIMWRGAQGMARAAMAALALRVTVNSLVSGQHIECKDLDELLGAEAAIVAACKSLKAYLETAQTFDGREEVVEF